MKKIKDGILAEGEVTGHAHRVKVDVCEDEKGVRHFEGETKITHEEHKEVELPDKKWNSDKVNEYDHFAEEVKKVQD